MAFPLLLCETFLKRSWQRAAVVLAALIALNGVPIETAEARRATVEAPASAYPVVEAAAPAQGAEHAAAAPAPASPSAEPAAQAPVETASQPPTAPAAAPAGEAHGTAPTGGRDAAHGQPPAHAPPAEGAPAHAGSQQEAAHDESIWPTIARLFNFAVLVGGLVYFLRTPFSHYLASRSQQIRGGLVTARETSARATAQLAEIDRRLQALPGELEALRVRGVEEISAEERRIQAQAEAERTRLIAEMQRDVEVRVRVAKQGLTEHAADLAVTLAAERVRQAITDADQARLVDRYASQVKDIHG
jgi:F0F1-type ATP synthase membrane subunit b/b'